MTYVWQYLPKTEDRCSHAMKQAAKEARYSLQLRHLFKYAELTKAVRQNDKLFINLLNKVWVYSLNLLKAKLLCESDRNYPKDALHIYVENEPAMKRNEAILSKFPSELYTTEANEKIPDNCKYTLALIRAAENQKLTNTADFAKLLKLKLVQKLCQQLI